MHIDKRVKPLVSGGLAALALCFTSGAAIAAPVTGAIFTTIIDGTAVNHNIYGFKEDVYLNGGPQPNAPCTAAGLPDGDYHFQVTDPSGKVLLSNDPIENRKVKVSGGVFVGLGDPPVGTHYVPQFNLPNVPYGQCNGITVQLAPFNSTPNMGGEYKVWITKVSDYKPGYGSFGFIPSKSKTDNFKVPNIDSDGDGFPDSEDNCPTEFDPTNVCGVIFG
jgi:hypothetical protein